jgi:RNA polymerase sigma-70 factor (ECF subfamily)
LTTEICDDAIIMAQIKKGDQAAMKELVEKYKYKAYHLALGIVGNKDEAFDISQEAFIRVHKSAGKFNPDFRFFPWFYSIIVNLCKDCLKRREQWDSKEIDLDDSDFLLINESNPEKIIIEKEQARNLRKAIMQLDFSNREIIMLKHFRDMSYDEISDLLGIPKGTVMSRLYYARKKLAEILGSYE